MILPEEFTIYYTIKSRKLQCYWKNPQGFHHFPSPVHGSGGSGQTPPPLFVNGQQSAARGKDPRLAGMVRAAERVSPFRII